MFLAFHSLLVNRIYLYAEHYTCEFNIIPVWCVIYVIQHTSILFTGSSCLLVAFIGFSFFRVQSNWSKNIFSGLRIKLYNQGKTIFWFKWLQLSSSHSSPHCVNNYLQIFKITMTYRNILFLIDCCSNFVIVSLKSTYKL